MDRFGEVAGTAERAVPLSSGTPTYSAMSHGGCGHDRALHVHLPARLLRTHQPPVRRGPWAWRDAAQARFPTGDCDALEGVRAEVARHGRAPQPTAAGPRITVPVLCGSLLQDRDRLGSSGATSARSASEGYLADETAAVARTPDRHYAFAVFSGLPVGAPVVGAGDEGGQQHPDDLFRDFLSAQGDEAARTLSGVWVGSHDEYSGLLGS